ncbi:MAG: RDD family protein [Bryobacterales bacterium]|nr:RDD family protein [Bryobacterales bacterium]
MPLAYAGFWRRSVAFVFDLTVMWLIFAVTMSVLGHANPKSKFLATIPAALYLIVAEASAGQASPGKRLAGIRVMEANGRRVTLARATVRTALQFAPWLALISGLPWLVTAAVIPYVIALAGILLGRKHRSWYDRLSGTAVIRPPSP